jgi:hypothetical protein
MLVAVAALINRREIGAETGRNRSRAVGLFFRKSVNFGPLRLNLSKSGVGASVGVRGARVSFSPRGTYVNMGAHGVYYRKRIDGSGPIAGGTASLRSRHSEPVPGSSFAAEIRSADVEQLVETSSQELLAEINQRVRLFPFAPLVWTIGVACTVGAVALSLSQLGEKGPGVAAIACGIGMFGTAAVALPAATRDSRKRTTPLFYELGEPAERRFAEIQHACAALAEAHRVWRIRSAERQTDWKRHAGASTSVEREQVRAGRMNAPYIATNVETWGIDCGRTKLFFFPDHLFVFEGGTFGAVSYESLGIKTAESRFIEDDRVPSDATVVGQTWQYVRRDGGPDLRFANNRQLPVALYGSTVFTSPQGLNIYLEVSNIAAASRFAERLATAKSVACSSAAAGATRQDQHGHSMSQSRVAALRVLALDPSASAQEIKAAYRRMVQMYHPDKVATLAPDYRELAHRRMKDINSAYGVLIDEREQSEASEQSSHAIKFRCPHCNAKLSAPAGYAEQWCKCPECKRSTQIPRSHYSAARADSVAAMRDGSPTLPSSVLSALSVGCRTFDGWVKTAAGEGNDIIYRFFQVMLYVGLPTAIAIVVAFNR